jgi:hypothetical protein
MRLTILVAVLVLVSGCYESNELLLDSAAARQPIAHNRDWIYDSGNRHNHARLSLRPDGWYDYSEASIEAGGKEGPWHSRAVLLNFLGAVHSFGVDYDVFVYATYNQNDSAYLYGLVVVGKDGYWQTIMPNCDPANANAKWLQSDTKAAQAAGANIKAIDEVDRVCHFTTHDQLYAAMRTVVAEPGFWERVRMARS